MGQMTLNFKLAYSTWLRQSLRTRAPAYPTCLPAAYLLPTCCRPAVGSAGRQGGRQQ